MTHPDSRTSPNRTLRTDADLHELLSLLLGEANQRQLWFIMMDDRKRITGPLMPMEDYPDSPESLCDTEDLGRATVAEVLADRARMMCELVGGSEIVLVWERPGSDKFTDADLAWARDFVREAGKNGSTLRAQFLLHDGGLRQLTPDDYA